MYNKKLGVVAGLGPETSAVFYLNVINHFRKNTKTYPSIIMRNVGSTFEDVESFICNRDTEPHVKDVIDALKDLEASGCDIACIPCNTMHVHLERFKSAVPKMNIISIVESVLCKILKNGTKNILLLGSSATISCRLYQDHLDNNGVKYILPNEIQQQWVENAILNINGGNLLGGDRIKLEAIISSYIEDYGVDSVLLGCTDLYQQIDIGKYSVPVVDSNMALVEAVCNFITNKVEDFVDRGIVA